MNNFMQHADLIDRSEVCCRRCELSGKVHDCFIMYSLWLKCWMLNVQYNFVICLEFACVKDPCRFSAPLRELFVRHCPYRSIKSRFHY